MYSMGTCESCGQGDVEAVVLESQRVVLICDECSIVWCDPADLGTDRVSVPRPPDWLVCGGDRAKPGTVRSATGADLARAGWSSGELSRVPAPQPVVVRSKYPIPDYHAVLQHAVDWSRSRGAAERYGDAVLATLNIRLAAAYDGEPIGRELYQSAGEGWVDFSAFRPRRDSRDRHSGALNADGQALRDALTFGIEQIGTRPRPWCEIPPIVRNPSAGDYETKASGT